jgi:hypothetical protein
VSKSKSQPSFFSADFQRGHGRFSFFVAARRQTAANFSSFPDGGALPRRRYANHGRRSRVRRDSIRFPAGANVAQAFGHDAQPVGEISMPIPARIFKGTAEEVPDPWVSISRMPLYS